MKYVRVEEKDFIYKIILNRPEKRNAFFPDMIDELKVAFEKTTHADQARAVLLSGAGESFCAGADLEWMKSMVNYSLQENLEDSHQLFDMFLSARQCRIPIIGLLHGHVMGGALGLAAICDIALAEEKTQFCFSEVRLGLVPAVISPFVLHKMSPPWGSELMLTARLFSAEEARQSGLVQYVGAREDLDQQSEAILRRLKAVGPEAVAETKRLIRFVYSHEWSDYKNECSRVIAERRVSSEGQEGLRAFFAKEDPDFKL